MTIGRGTGEGSVATNVWATPDVCRRVRVLPVGTPTLCSDLLGGGILERCGEREALVQRRLRDHLALRPTGGPPDELLVLERPPAHFDPVLGQVLNASQSTKGLSGRSAMGPMSVRRAGPTKGWGGTAPSRPFICCRKESCIVASKAWMSWYLSTDSDGPFVPRVCASEVSVEGRNTKVPGADEGRGIACEGWRRPRPFWAPVKSCWRVAGTQLAGPILTWDVSRSLHGWMKSHWEEESS